MMILRRGEKLLDTHEVKTRYGKCAMHISNKHICLEKNNRGCIMMVSLNDVSSCLLDENSGKRGHALKIGHRNGSYVDIHSMEAEKLADAINSALAQYRSALAKIGAVPAERPAS